MKDVVRILGICPLPALRNHYLFLLFRQRS